MAYYLLKGAHGWEPDRDREGRNGNQNPET